MTKEELEQIANGLVEFRERYMETLTQDERLATWKSFNSIETIVSRGIYAEPIQIITRD